MNPSVDFLVRIGRLTFDDFCLLDSSVVSNLQSSILHPESPWSLALANAPHVLAAFRRFVPDLSAPFPAAPLSLSAIHAAQSALVEQHALGLLIAKAPALYDALPWNDWDSAPVLRKLQLWRTRFLLAGDGTSVLLSRLRKSAGVIAWEPRPRLARYLELKAEKEKVKRFRLLPSSLGHLTTGPLPSVDVAILGSPPFLPEPWDPRTLEPFLSIPSLFLVEDNPLCPPLDAAALTALGFTRSEVQVRTLGPRPLWSRLS